MEYEVIQSTEFPSEWRVEAIDYKTGDIFVALFGSAKVEERAREYARWKENQPQG